MAVERMDNVGIVVDDLPAVGLKPTVSLDGQVRDLEAVIDAVSSEPAAVLGVFHSGPPSVAYAAARPERVSHLLLWSSYAVGTDYWRAAQPDGLRVLRQTDYRLFLRTAADELLGWADDEEADRFSTLMAAAVSPEGADRLIAETRAFDVTGRPRRDPGVVDGEGPCGRLGPRLRQPRNSRAQRNTRRMARLQRPLLKLTSQR